VIALKEEKLLQIEKVKILSNVFKENGLEDPDMQEMAIQLLGSKVKYDSEKEKFYLMIDDQAITVEDGIKKLIATDLKIQKLQKSSSVLTSEAKKESKKPIILKKETKKDVERKSEVLGSQYRPFRIVNGQKVFRE
jgi:hypothetical protein